MKIGVSSYSFAKYIKAEKCDYFKICDIAKEIGFDGIEFVDLNFEGFNITDDPNELAPKIKEYCDKIGLEIPAYTVGANFIAREPEQEVERLCKCVDVAQMLGARVFRHDICWSLPEEKGFKEYTDVIEKISPYIRKITEYAEKKGIKTCSENHGMIFQAPNRMVEMFLAVNHSNYGLLCDIGNFLCADCESVKSVGTVAPYIFHLHAKDFLYKEPREINPDGFMKTLGGNFIRGTVLGHGIVDIPKCVEIAKNSGYDGFVSLEFEGMEECIPAIKMGYEYLKKII